MVEKKGHGKGGRLRVEGMQTAQKGGRRWRTRGTKGGAPFSAALKDKGSITQKVLAVNVYLTVHSNDCGRC